MIGMRAWAAVAAMFFLRSHIVDRHLQEAQFRWRQGQVFEVDGHSQRAGAGTNEAESLSCFSPAPRKIVCYGDKNGHLNVPALDKGDRLRLINFRLDHASPKNLIGQFHLRKKGSANQFLVGGDFCSSLGEGRSAEGHGTPCLQIGSRRVPDILKLNHELEARASSILLQRVGDANGADFDPRTIAGYRRFSGPPTGIRSGTSGPIGPVQKESLDGRDNCQNSGEPRKHLCVVSDDLGGGVLHAFFWGIVCALAGCLVVWMTNSQSAGDDGGKGEEQKQRRSDKSGPIEF